MNSTQIRKKFLEFFEKHGHTIVPSSSLIPAEDPTLLFTNAGMNQFKDVFLNKEKRLYTQATSIQKCVRAGGKHNDLDQVGFTERHLTFFEMMGNFSFGNYFKKEAIEFAWTFLTEEMKLSAKKLYTSVYLEDEEAYNIWLNDIKLDPTHIVKLGKEDNFWQMGDTGPCGPCSEIYLDQGKGVGCKRSVCQPGCECSRFVEIWNLVFMQYDQQLDGTLKPLAQTGVDTGMGFERLCMVMQGKKNVFHIDSMQYLINKIEELTGVLYNKSDDKTKATFHVLADHIRSTSLLIADGCSPSNDGRGYVLRKIIRRAALFTQKISSDKKLFTQLAKAFIEHMSSIYPELTTNAILILSVLDSEIERFAQNLITGQNILDKYFKKNREQGISIITGKQMFKLYDTYGFPPELTTLIGMENDFSVDMPNFKQEMKKQQAQSGKKMKEVQTEDITVENLSTKFVGYEKLENESKIQLVSKGSNFTWISTEESPFYVESGGQVSDQGTITINQQTFHVVELKKSGETFKPTILIKISNKIIDGKAAKDISIGDKAHSVIDKKIRANTIKNHTATHMLQAALLKVLGPQVKQAGSIVHDTYLRFDFTHHQPMSKEEIVLVENIVNDKIQEAIKTNISSMTLKEAKNRGIISFFGEKYNPEKVRVVEIPNFSAELCGGTHAENTGVIGALKIISETALSTGTRRIVAITGPEAVNKFQQDFDIVKTLGEHFKVKADEVVASVKKLQEQQQQALTTIKQLKKQLFNTHLPQWLDDVIFENNIPFLFLELENYNNDELKDICNQLSQKKPGFYFLVNKPSKESKRFSFVGFLSKEYMSVVDLTAFAAHLRDSFGIKGGGSPTFMQGGGQELPANLKEEIQQWLNK